MHLLVLHKPKRLYCGNSCTRHYNNISNSVHGFSSLGLCLNIRKGLMECKITAWAWSAMSAFIKCFVPAVSLSENTHLLYKD